MYKWLKKKEGTSVWNPLLQYEDKDFAITYEKRLYEWEWTAQEPPFNTHAFEGTLIDARIAALRALKASGDGKAALVLMAMRKKYGGG